MENSSSFREGLAKPVVVAGDLSSDADGLDATRVALGKEKF